MTPMTSHAGSAKTQSPAQGLEWPANYGLSCKSSKPCRSSQLQVMITIQGRWSVNCKLGSRTSAIVIPVIWPRLAKAVGICAAAELRTVLCRWGTTRCRMLCARVGSCGCPAVMVLLLAARRHPCSFLLLVLLLLWRRHMWHVCRAAALRLLGRLPLREPAHQSQSTSGLGSYLHQRNMISRSAAAAGATAT